MAGSHVASFLPGNAEELVQAHAVAAAPSDAALRFDSLEVADEKSDRRSRMGSTVGEAGRPLRSAARTRVDPPIKLGIAEALPPTEMEA